MLRPRLVKRFIFSAIAIFLVLVMVDAVAPFPLWVFALTVPAAALITVWYWRSFSSTMICPRCNGTGKVTKQHGRDYIEDYCPSCDGEGRVPKPASRF